MNIHFRNSMCTQRRFITTSIRCTIFALALLRPPDAIQAAPEPSGIPSSRSSVRETADHSATSRESKPANTVFIDVFVRDGCESCTKARDWLDKYQRENPGIKVRTYNLSHDKTALAVFWQLARQFKFEKPGLPAFRACGQFKIGFTESEVSGPQIEEMLTIHAFVREGCMHCRDAKAFLGRLKERWPGLRVVHHDIIADSHNRDRMLELGRQHGVQVQSVPGLLLCGRFLVGYQTDETTGRQISELLESSNDLPKLDSRRGAIKSNNQTVMLVAFPVSGENNAHQDDNELLPIPEEASTSEETTAAAAKDGDEPPEEIEVPLLGRLVVRDWSLPGFTFVVGLLDGFNPCAMWVLVLLLSLLVNIRDRRKILAIAGTFVLVSGLAYFTFMAAWLNVFTLIGMVRTVQIVLGALAIFIGAVNIKEFVAFKRGVSLSIPEAAKPGIYRQMRRVVTAKYLPAAIAAAIVLAVVVNVIELLCTAGLPAVYTEILTLQHLPAWQNYAYLGLYIIAYMLDDTIMLTIAVVTLSHRRMQESEGRWLKLVSGLVILAIGVLMLLKPDWLR